MARRKGRGPRLADTGTIMTMRTIITTIMLTTTITAMAMGRSTTTRMTTDPAKLMRLQSWFSPAFPIGAYSYSHGLEWAVEAGTVRDRASLVDWLDADIRHGAGRSEGIFFAQAWRAARQAVALSQETETPGSPARAN